MNTTTTTTCQLGVQEEIPQCKERERKYYVVFILHFNMTKKVNTGEEKVKSRYGEKMK